MRAARMTVLERIVALDEGIGDESALAHLAQPVALLLLVARRRGLRFAKRLELVAAEEVAVAADDLRLVGGLLLADPDGTCLLGALVQVLREAILELGGAANDGDCHGRTLARRDETPRDLDELRRLERLRQHSVRAPLVAVNIDGPAHERNRDPGRPQLVEQPVGGAAAQVEVEKDDGRPLGRTAALASSTVPASRTVKPSSSRLTRQTSRRAGSVLDNQDRVGGTLHARRW